MIQIKHKITGVVLTEVDGANLREANLREANLREVNLREANLREANLREANLYWANLRGADLRGADLRGADLRGADLRGADLRGADLRGADLRGADLRGADLRGANLADAKGLEQQAVAAEGDLVGYKRDAAGAVVTLRIPRAAARVNAYGSRKCRAAYAVVSDAPEGSVSRYDSTTRYVKGRRVTPDSYDPDPRVECSHGIHFFLTRAEAEAY